MTSTRHDGGSREEQPEDAEDVRRSADSVDEQHRHRRPVHDGTGINPGGDQGTDPRPDGRGRSSGHPDAGDAP
jgi:hypothetical protein